LKCSPEGYNLAEAKNLPEYILEAVKLTVIDSINDVLKAALVAQADI
jgi:hypothetical protein